MSKSYRMPDYTFTTDPIQHGEAWDAYVAPIEEATGWSMTSFNPGATFLLRGSENVVHLDPEALFQLREAFLKIQEPTK